MQNEGSWPIRDKTGDTPRETEWRDSDIRLIGVILESDYAHEGSILSLEVPEISVH